jgi:hypothetical protein
VLRIDRSRRGLRGQIVAVWSGETRLFNSLREALAIVRAGFGKLAPLASRRRPTRTGDEQTDDGST